MRFEWYFVKVRDNLQKHGSVLQRRAVFSTIKTQRYGSIKSIPRSRTAISCAATAISPSC